MYSMEKLARGIVQNDQSKRPGPEIIQKNPDYDPKRSYFGSSKLYCCNMDLPDDDDDEERKKRCSKLF